MTGRHRTPDVPTGAPLLTVESVLARHPGITTDAAMAVRTEDDRATAWWARQHSRAAAMAVTGPIQRVVLP